MSISSDFLFYYIFWHRYKSAQSVFTLTWFMRNMRRFLGGAENAGAENARVENVGPEWTGGKRLCAVRVFGVSRRVCFDVNVLEKVSYVSKCPKSGRLYNI